MIRFEEAMNAFLDQLRAVGAEPGEQIEIFDVSVPLIEAGCTQDELIDVLFKLEGDRVIRLAPGNRLEVLKPLQGPA